MNRFTALAACLWVSAASAAADTPPATTVAPPAHVVVVVGAAGSPEYADLFQQWAQRWQAAARQAGADLSVIGLDDASDLSDRQVLADCLARVPSPASEPLWLVLLGHGTFDGKTARYNLRGPDVTPAELAEWLKAVDRPIAVLNCTSASAPFLPALSGPRRVVITATRSGFEYNFARLGGFLAEAIQDRSADLDKDDQVSLLEAFLKAFATLREFYAQDGRLMTEHALLDDNGDGLGTPADWFQGLLAVKVAKEGATPDGAAARQWVLLRSPQEERLGPELRARRDALEQQLSALKAEKGQLSEEEYLARIEPVLVALAELYEQAEGSQPPSGGPAQSPAPSDGVQP
jgi:hypothetical protein